MLANWSHRNQLFLLLAVPMVLFSGFMGWMSYRSAETLIIRDAIRLTGLMADEREKALLRHLKAQQEDATSFMRVVRTACRRGALTDPACTRSALSEYMKSVGSPAAYVQMKSLGRVDVNLAGREFPSFVPLRPGQIAFFSHDPTGHPFYYLQVEENKGERLMILHYDSSDIDRIFADAPALSRTGDTFLVDASGALLTSPKLLPSGLPRSRAVSQCKAGESGEARTYDDPQTPVIQGFRYLSELGGGCVIAEIEEDKAFGSLRELRARLLVSRFAYAGFALLLCYLIATLTTRPLERLRKRAMRMRDGDLGSEIPSGGPRELQVLSATLREVSTALLSEIRNREEFVYMVTHDLKNPLSAMELSVGLLAKLGAGGGPPEQSRVLASLAERLQKACSRMDRLVLDILDLARLGAGTFRIEACDGDFPKAVSDAALAFKSAADTKRVRLRVEVPDDTCLVRFDSDRVMQVLANLIGNALKFTPPGGEIRISLKAGVDWVTVLVADTGMGIAAADLSHLFERYWQSERTRKLGTGLGLYICKSIVEAHGGRIWAESEQGKGSCFCFTLPRVAASVERAS